MNYHDAELESRSFSTGVTPLNVYCSKSTCNLLMPKGTPARVYDAATFTHVVCPTGIQLRNFAAHKQPDSGMKLDADRA